MARFNIHIASQLSGVQAATIRAWEKRYNVLQPVRDENGHRFYADEDIDKLATLYELTQRGHSIGKIAKLSIADLKSLASTATVREKSEDNFEDMEAMRTGVFLALSMYKLDIISYELEKAKNTLSPRDFALEFIVPLFREIGIRSMEGRLTVAQEHTLSAIAQFHIGQMITRHYIKHAENREPVILAAPEGELHEIGLFAACLLCIEYDLPFIFMGKDMPVESLAETAHQLKASLIILGVVHETDPVKYKPLKDFLKELRGAIPSSTQLQVGGNLKPWVKTEVQQLGIGHLPSLETLDQFLSTHTGRP